MNSVKSSKDDFNSNNEEKMSNPAEFPLNLELNGSGQDKFNNSELINTEMEYDGKGGIF